jgi:hypothetical protein
MTQCEGAILRISVALIYFLRRVRIARRFFCLVSFWASFVLVSREFNAYMYSFVYAKGSPLSFCCSSCSSAWTACCFVCCMWHTTQVRSIKGKLGTALQIFQEQGGMYFGRDYTHRFLFLSSDNFWRREWLINLKLKLPVWRCRRNMKQKNR